MCLGQYKHATFSHLQRMVQTHQKAVACTCCSVQASQHMCFMNGGAYQKLMSSQVLAGFGGAAEPETANIDRYSTEDLEHLLHDVLWHELQQASTTAASCLSTALAMHTMAEGAL